jgi:long-chain acyl-CoA synthetase
MSPAMMLRAETIVELLCRRVETDGLRPALAIKRGGAYQWLTWNDIAAAVPQVVAMLVELGLRPGDRVAQVSENRYEWIVADFAIQMAGAVHVPIHPTLAGPQIAWQILHSGAKVVLLSGPHQAVKLAALEGECPRDVAWVTYEPCTGVLRGQPIHLLTELQATANLGKGVEAAWQARKQITADSLATILYTSGTTGEPKGVMLTQGNLTTNAIATVDAFGWSPDQLRVNFLPLSHIFARTCDLYLWIADGSRLALAESRETVIADCQAIHPTYLNGVPYFYDKIYRALCAEGRHNEPGALKAFLGGAIDKCCAGGAALPGHLYDFFESQGVLLLQGYGLSESSPVITISTEAYHRRASCGRPIPDVDVRIADDGEILTRGPHVMQGYYENPEATADVLKDGWLHTGDLGRLDDDGFLYITGRKKEILVTSAGKNIAPVFLESLLTQDPLILQAMVIGDGRSYLTALIVLNNTELDAGLKRLGIPHPDEASRNSHPAVMDLVRQRIDRCLSGVSPHEQVRKFTLLARPFSIEAGELTPKLSLRRAVIESHFAPQIAAMYDAKQGSC